MNTKEYISSGAIESCVLGLATEAEQQELTDLCGRYPDIAAAKASFEASLETGLLAEALTPPAGLKAGVLEKIKNESVAQTAQERIDRETPVRTINPWKWVAAASILLLAGAGWWAFQTNRQYNELKLASSEMQRRLDAQSEQLATIQNDADRLRQQGLRMVAMHGSDNKAIYATVYWDTLSKDVFLSVNNLPQPATDKQYQLWALLDGQPIDLGLIEPKQQRLLYQMKNVQNAQAFAITLEPKGGRPTPSTPPVVLSNL